MKINVEFVASDAIETELPLLELWVGRAVTVVLVGVVCGGVVGGNDLWLNHFLFSKLAKPDG